MKQARFLLFRNPPPGRALEYVTQDRRSKTYNAKGTLDSAALFYSKDAAALIRERIGARYGPPEWMIGEAPAWLTTPAERHNQE